MATAPRRARSNFNSKPYKNRQATAREQDHPASPRPMAHT